MHRYLNPAKYYRLLYEKIGPEPKVAFLHIPKTGGTYVNQWISGRLPVIWPIKYYNHQCVVKSDSGESSIYPPKGLQKHNNIPKREIEKYDVVASVRNPFSWLVSYWAHSIWDEKGRENVNHYDYENAKKGFGYLVKIIVSREDVWPSRKFLFFQLFCDDGDLVANWVIRQETLDNDLQSIAQQYGLRYKKYTKARVSFKKERDYREYYTDDLAQIVSDIYNREISLFGYTFDGIDFSKKSFTGFIKDKKELVKYFWDDDRFELLSEEQLTENKKHNY